VDISRLKSIYFTIADISSKTIVDRNSDLRKLGEVSERGSLNHVIWHEIATATGDELLRCLHRTTELKILR
jgi:hypothetical protein